MSLVQSDFSQAELRVMACLSNDPDMIALFQPDSPDFFDVLMPSVFPEDFKDLAEFEAFNRDFPVKSKEMRTSLKTVVYGLGFGRQAAAIAQEIGSSYDYAQGIIDNFLGRFPLFKQWRFDIMDAAVDHDLRDILVTPFGRAFNSEVITDRNRQSVINAALAFLPQSTASDLCLQAAIRVNNKFRVEGWEAKIVCLVHDAILVDCRPDVAQNVADLLQYEMRSSGRRIFGDTVVFDTEASIGEDWSELS